MDQFSAHLDRGWELIQNGDPRGAELSAHRALELDGDSPEAYNLLGYVAALRGDFEQAVESYQQAIALDETYLEAILNAAEIFIHPLADFDTAERLCEDALELAETDDERVDALLLKFDALLGKQQIDAAKELCRRFPNGPFDNPSHAFLVGRALYEVGDIQRAAQLIEEAVRRTPKNPEAHYYRGLLADDRGETKLAVQSFLRSLELDTSTPPPTWSLSPDSFRETVLRCVERLPEELRGMVDLDAVHIAALPGVEVVADGIDPRALLLVDAVSEEALAGGDSGSDSEVKRPEAPAPGVSEPHARVFVYQRNVERMAGGIDGLNGELMDALERELRALLESPLGPPPHA